MQGETKEDFGWLVAEQASEPVLFSTPDFSHLLQTPFIFMDYPNVLSGCYPHKRRLKAGSSRHNLFPTYTDVHLWPVSEFLQPAPKEALGPCNLFEVLEHVAGEGEAVLQGFMG